jgi:hypothetical protein
VCWTPLFVFNLHHRRPRGMGGSKDPRINDPANLLALCGSGTTGCHGLIESYRERSYEHGWLLRHGWDAELTPFVDLRGHWWLLTGEQKLPLSLPFPAPNPRSIRPAPGVGLSETPREEENDRPY